MNSSNQQSTKTPELTLYEYDHCPFCMHVRMVLAQSKLRYKIKTLAYDDAATPSKLVGKKILPILCEPEHEPMPESLDIMTRIESIAGKKLYHRVALDEEIKQQLHSLNSVAGLLYKPRIIKLALGEFPSPQAIDYYIQRHSPKMGMSFEQALANTQQYIAIAQPIMDYLDSRLNTEQDFFYGNELSSYDLEIWPRLRNLSVVPELRLSNKLVHYINQHCVSTAMCNYQDCKTN